MSGITTPSQLVNQIPISIEFPRNLDKLAEQLTIVYKRIAYTLNTKQGGLYSQTEFTNSELYNLNATDSFKIVYRKCFDMVALNLGPIAAGATVSFLHNIASLVQLVHMYGGAKNSDVPTKFIPLPYVSATLVTDQVQIYLTPTNIVLVNGSTQTALTQATIVCEYLKN